jgi:tRNA pseudouridine13 synthase
VDDRQALNKKSEQLLSHGVPNYFGEQRFGRNGNNLQEAQRMLVEEKRYRDKQKRGLILSAARSYLFNLVLAKRVTAGNWCAHVDGDVDNYPSGPLWGRGRPIASGALAEFEQQTLGAWKEWCNGLEHAGLTQERRPLRLMPSAASYEWKGTHLQLTFSLAAGEFATSVLREVADLKVPVSLPE